jgi:hypothetical protein
MIDEKFAGEIINYLVNEVNQSLPERFNERLPWNFALAWQSLGEIRNPSQIDRVVNNLIEKTLEIYKRYIFSGIGFQKFNREHILPAVLNISNLTAAERPVVEFIKNIGGISFGVWFGGSPVIGLGKFLGKLGSQYESLREAALVITNADELGVAAEVGLSTITYGWKDRPDTQALLRQLSTSRRLTDIRSLAIMLLGEHYNHEPSTLPLLQEVALSSDEDEICAKAIETINLNYEVDEKFLRLLHDLLDNDPGTRTRGTIISVLGKHYKDDADTRLILQESSLKDEASSVRVTAMTTLVKHFNDEQTLLLLKDRALRDPEILCQVIAINALAERFPNTEQLLELLTGIAKNDASTSIDSTESGLSAWMVRHIALQRIAEHWPSHPGTLALLREQAEKDPVAEVRELAQQLADTLDRGRR